MTIEEACQLVIQAAAIGRPGEALVLDMGKPVRIVDMARQLMEQSGRRVPITFTGLREGEKLHEELFGEQRAARRAAVAPDGVPRAGSAVLRDRIEELPTLGTLPTCEPRWPVSATS